MKKILFVFLSIFISTVAFSQTTWYWTNGGGDNLFNNASNWDDGFFNSGVPSLGDDAIFDPAFSTDNCTIDAAVTVANIRLISGYTGIVSVNNGISISISNDFEIQDGTFSGGNTAIAISRDFNISGGSYSQPTAALTVTRNFSLSAGSFTGSAAAITITGLFSQTGGTYTSTSGTATIRGSFEYVSGTFTHNNGIFAFNTNSQRIEGSPSFFRLNLQGPTVNTVLSYSITGNPTVNNILNINWGAAASPRAVAVVGTGTIIALGDVTLNSNSTYTITPVGVTYATIDIAGTGAQNLTGLASGGARFPNIRINKSSGTLTLNNIVPFWGDLTYVAGSVSSGTSTVSFYGNNVNGGSASFNNVIINNTVTLTGSLNITGILTLTANSTFVTTGQTCTLKSTSGATASLASVPGTATITGDITGERFMPGGTAGFSMIGSPVSGKTYGDLGGAFYYATSYGESVSGSYTNGHSYLSAGSSLAKGEGFWVNDASATDRTISLSGPPYTGSYTYNLSYTSPNGTNTVPQDGWNLLSNIYLAPMNIDNSNFTFTNADATIYVYNQDLASGAGDFDYWNKGSPGSGSGLAGATMTSGLIPSFQGFWVHANAIGGSVSVNESVKSSGNPTFMKNATAVETVTIKLLLDGQNFSTNTYVKFRADATSNFDPEFDVYKLFSYSPNVPAIFTKISDVKCASNNLPPLVGDLDMPVYVKVGISGTYKISADSSIVNVLPNTCIVLYDTYTGITTDLRTHSYSFEAYDTTSTARFVLKVLPNSSLQLTNSITQPDTANLHGSIVCSPAGNGPWSFTWKDSTNQIIKQSNNKLLSDTLNNVAQGIYSVDVISENLNICGNAQQSYTLVAEKRIVTTSLSELKLGNNIVIGTDNNTDVFVQIVNPLSSKVVVSVYNLMGQKLTEDIIINNGVNGKTIINLKKSETQIAVVSARTDNSIVNKRIFINKAN